MRPIIMRQPYGFGLMQDWQEQRELILYRLDQITHSLEDLNEKQELILEKQSAQSERISVMEIKSGFLGTIGGFVGGLCSGLVEWLRHNIH